jgi:hypothetical protein
LPPGECIGNAQLGISSYERKVFQHTICGRSRSLGKTNSTELPPMIAVQNGLPKEPGTLFRALLLSEFLSE